MENIQVFVLFIFFGGIHSFIHQYITLLASATNCSYIHPHPCLPPLSNPSFFFFFFPKECLLSLVETFLVRSHCLSEEEQHNIFVSEGERDCFLNLLLSRREDMRKCVFQSSAPFFPPLPLLVANSYFEFELQIKAFFKMNILLYFFLQLRHSLSESFSCQKKVAGDDFSTFSHLSHSANKKPYYCCTNTRLHVYMFDQ